MKKRRIMPLILLISLVSTIIFIPSTVFSAGWDEIEVGLHGGFVSNDQHYQKAVLPTLPETKNWSGIGWRGEKLSTELLLWTKEGASQVKLTASELSGPSGNKIPAANVSTRFMKYVIADDGANGCGGNGSRPTQLIADVLDTATQADIGAANVQPVWLTFDIPANTVPGTYSGNILVSYQGGIPLTFTVSIEVLNVTLPAVSQWKYHHDQWQNPWAVARYLNVEPWSQAHWDYLRSHLELAYDGGQKVITTTIQKDTWNGQTYDKYDTMVKWTKKTDGSWEYDYSIFDRYVELCLDIGINKYINCYSMIPWGNRLFYMDEAQGAEKIVTPTVGSTEWEAYWRPFLTSFSEHLKQKGWFNITNIAMDERSEADMKATVELIKATAPGLGVSLAGGWHSTLEPDIRDYCIDYPQLPSNITAIAEARRLLGKNTTYYVCCSTPKPNNFTYSTPSENVWLGWYAANLKVDGTLRWAYDSWVADPLLDTRHSSFQSGDCFMVYPGLRSSVRWERLREGIQDYEKIRYLRENLNAGWLAQLEEVVSTFFKGQNYTTAINTGKSQMNFVVKSWLAGDEAPVPKVSLALNKPSSASNSEAAYGRGPEKGNDGISTTRWCAVNGNINNWWKVDLGASYELSGTEVKWELNDVYKYKIEVSEDDINWTVASDRTGNTEASQVSTDSFRTIGRYVRITITGLPYAKYASFYEFKVFEEQISKPSEAILTGPTSINLNEEFTLNYDLKGVENVLAQDIIISFNPENFEFIAAESALEGVKIAYVCEKFPDIRRILMASEGQINAINGDKSVLKLHLKAKKNFGSDAINLTKVTLADGEGKETELTAVSKSLVITNGDVSGDGMISIGDLGIIANYYGYTSSDPEWAEASKCDVNGDNKIGIEDFVNVASRILGL